MFSGKVSSGFPVLAFNWFTFCSKFSAFRFVKASLDFRFDHFKPAFSGVFLTWFDIVKVFFSTIHFSAFALLVI